MEVKFTYSKLQLEATVRFIGTHNKNFIGRYNYIRDRILEKMNDLAQKFPACEWIGTMGFIISADVVSEESIEKDKNIVIFELLVDPAVSQGKWCDNDFVEVIVEVKSNVKAV
jgi:hypothetical protein